ncbi:hypothetical protein NB11A_15600 [Ligilactobacillus agilis]|nr:hypothetical protein NB11A_15600 [Ligilactobacillus agilis]
MSTLRRKFLDKLKIKEYDEISERGEGEEKAKLLTLCSLKIE